MAGDPGANYTNYTITYYTNVSYNNKSATTQTDNINITIPDIDDIFSNFVYPNHNFICWNSSIDGTGTDYTPEDEIQINSDITFYAKWEITTNENLIISKHSLINLADGVRQISPALRQDTLSITDMISALNNSGIKLKKILNDNNLSYTSGTRAGIYISTGITVLQPFIIIVSTFENNTSSNYSTGGTFFGIAIPNENGEYDLTKYTFGSIYPFSPQYCQIELVNGEYKLYVASTLGSGKTFYLRSSSHTISNAGTWGVVYTL